MGDLVKFSRALAAGKLLGAKGTEAEKAGGLSVAGGAPGCNALLEANGPYTFVVLSNFDPPAAERFVRTVGRMIQRTANAAGGGIRSPRGS